MKDGENKLLKQKMANIWFLNETCIKEIDWLGKKWYFIDCAIKISDFFFLKGLRGKGNHFSSMWTCQDFQ